MNCFLLPWCCIWLIYTINTAGKFTSVFVVIHQLVKFFIAHVLFSLAILWINYSHIINAEGKLFSVPLLVDSLLNASFLDIMANFFGKSNLYIVIQLVSSFQCLLLIDNWWIVSFVMLKFLRNTDGKFNSVLFCHMITC